MRPSLYTPHVRLALLGLVMALLVSSSCDVGAPAPDAAQSQQTSIGLAPVEPAEPGVGTGAGVPIVTPRGEGRLIDALARAYENRDAALLGRLLAPDDAPYAFLGRGVSWDAPEELRIASRMFDPQNVPPGDPPVPADLWIIAIEVALKQMSPWTERPDLYRSATNPDGLDPTRWRATEAQYRTAVFVDTQGATDFQIDAIEDFVVIEDLDQTFGPRPNFFLYRWDDALPAATALPVSWTGLKGLYR